MQETGACLIAAIVSKAAFSYFNTAVSHLLVAGSANCIDSVGFSQAVEQQRHCYFADQLLQFLVVEMPQPLMAVWAKPFSVSEHSDGLQQHHTTCLNICIHEAH